MIEIYIFLFMCIAVCLVQVIDDVSEWFLSKWESISDYIYDLGADLEGIKECGTEDKDNA